MKKVLVTGSHGFVTGYLIQELIDNGYEVIGIDNFSKYGKVRKEFEHNENFTFIEGDAKNVELMKELSEDVDYIIACAGMIGGIVYFNRFAYDLLVENELINIAAFQAANHAFKNRKLKKIMYTSSSMIYGEFNDPNSSSKEGDEYNLPPSKTAYGFQKLAGHYLATSAYYQHGLPYTISIPFNCIGTGEKRSILNTDNVNVNISMSHVVPDLVAKILLGQNPLHILGSGNQIRHYTYGGDIARGMVMALENPKAENESFNFASPKSHTVIELAQTIWNKTGTKGDLTFIHDKPYKDDVQVRIPSIEKSKKILGFEAKVSLEEALDEIIPYVQYLINTGEI